MSAVNEGLILGLHIVIRFELNTRSEGSVFRDSILVSHCVNVDDSLFNMDGFICASLTKV